MLKIKCLLLSCITLSLAACDEGTEKTKIQVLEKTAAKIALINKDGGKLYYYFKGVFQALGAQNRHTKPSEILTFLGSKESGINEATKLLYMSATRYINLVVEPHFTSLDEAFNKKMVVEKNNVEATWKWFDGHFKQYGLAEPFKAYKLQLIKEDQAVQAAAAQGIFHDDTTLFFVGAPFEYKSKK